MSALRDDGQRVAKRRPAGARRQRQEPGDALALVGDGRREATVIAVPLLVGVALGWKYGPPKLVAEKGPVQTGLARFIHPLNPAEEAPDDYGSCGLGFQYLV